MEQKVGLNSSREPLTSLQPATSTGKSPSLGERWWFDAGAEAPLVRGSQVFHGYGRPIPVRRTVITGIRAGDAPVQLRSPATTGQVEPALSQESRAKRAGQGLNNVVAPELLQCQTGFWFYCYWRANPAEAVWKWLRAEVTANTCFGRAATVAAAVRQFSAVLDERADEVKRRCHSELQTAAVPETARHPERRERRLGYRRDRALKAALPM
jgi:hypothetical protein